jgi:hypothetical protein
MWMRALSRSGVLILVLAIVWTTGRAWGIGSVLVQTKEELKLKYNVVVEGDGIGRITVVLTLDDEGRLKPLETVELTILSKDNRKGNTRGMDLVVAIDMLKVGGGKRVGRVHILRELAERAEIRFNTHTIDGKLDPLTRLHHVIPLAEYIKAL